MKTKWEGKTGQVTCVGKCGMKYSEVAHYLLKEHFIESDASKTHSGTERFWIFEIASGTALAFEYSDVLEELYVGTNAPLENFREVISEFVPKEFEGSTGVMWD